jgi:hypothetical protein
MLRNFFKWFLYTVLASLAPFLALTIVHVVVKGALPSLVTLIGNGELLLICASLAAVGIGDVLTKGGVSNMDKLWSVWLFGVVVFIVAIAYTAVEVSQMLNHHYSDALITWGSILLFGCTNICNAICVGFSKK